MKDSEKEEQILKFWEEKKVYEKLKEMRKEGKKFFFLDGPPYATGSIHVGTAFNKVIKDCFLRFFRMQGFNTWDQPGYDCHGVPIENKVEKQLGFKSKKDIEKFGVENFIKECRKFATQFIDTMSNQFKNLGVWMDWENPYLTLTNDYIEGAWFTFKKAFEKGLLYKGSYPVHVCPKCETVVAYNEIEYAKVSDPSIYVKFKVKDKEKEFLLIWTTTPWTLPSNTGVMVKPDAEYARVKVGEEVLIIAKQLVENVLNKVGIKEFEILEVVKGKDLEGLRYEPPLKGLFPFIEKIENGFRVVLSDQFVTLEEGTGLVHTAPGHGQEDYKVGLETGLPAVSPVKMDGTYDESCGEYAGIFVKDADKKIIEELKERGLLLHEEKITHDYPLCWRCDSPLILMLASQWFFKVTAIREKLLKENEKIKWVPEWAKQRFRNWLESLGDWPISRQRYWGIPLPIWVCENCENIRVVGSRKELPYVPEDLHKPYIDEILLDCEKCGKKMRRVSDVLDVWFDSGVAPWASLGYPEKKEPFEKMFPADFILEGPDQIRGWWNSLMITSLMTFGKASFKSVLFHGFVLDVHGQKMSKSIGNIVTTEEVIEKYGRDVLRLYYLLSPPWEDYYFKWQDVEEIAKSFMIVKNVFNFVKTYVKSYEKVRKLEEEDKWIISRLNSLIESCEKNFWNYHSFKAAQEIVDFIINDFSRWYIKLIRDRVWPEYKGKDKKAAFFTLLTITENLAKLLAPFVPFFAEEVYQEIVKPLKGGEESVHLCLWPKANKKLIDKKLEEEMEVAKKIFEACSAARQKVRIKLRWPVSEVLVFSKEEKVLSALKRLEKILAFICNSKTVKIAEEEPKGYCEASFDFGKVFVNPKLDEKLMEEALLKELTRKIQEMRKKHGFKVEERIALTLESDEKTLEVIKSYSKKLKKEVGASKVSLGKLKGEFQDVLKFEDKEIKIAFQKLPPK
ncbi:MAG: isoleucine--tRNA ligase [Candidatus Aenigmatarchaeota archaeon]